MKDIVISKQLKEKVPHIQLSCIECDVRVQAKDETCGKELRIKLWNWQIR